MFFFNLNLFKIILLVSGYVYAVPLADESKLLSKLLPTPLTFVDIAQKNGFQCEEYNVTTSDGYIIVLFRIPVNASRPVLLMHGILDSADAFIIGEETSHALTLARAGFDVWAGNNRGNRYSRNHVTLDPDADACFWNYTFHEMGTLDMPPIIDLILERTGQSQLSAIGYSEGTTLFYVLGATNPKYNSKIKVLASIAPIAYLHKSIGIFPILLQTAPKINIVLEAVNYQEIIGFNSNIKALLRWICEIPVTGYDLCFAGPVQQLIGPDTTQIGKSIFPTIIEHFPAGTSKKNLLHYAQVGISKSFSQYDYGAEQNLKMYGSSTPPDYDLTKVTFDVGLYCGPNDYLSTIANVEILRDQLPNVVDYQIVPYLLWNHFDHLHAKDLPKYLQPLLLKLLSKYNS